MKYAFCFFVQKILRDIHVFDGLRDCGGLEAVIGTKTRWRSTENQVTMDFSDLLNGGYSPITMEFQVDVSILGIYKYCLF